MKGYSYYYEQQEGRRNYDAVYVSLFPQMNLWKLSKHPLHAHVCRAPHTSLHTQRVWGALEFPIPNSQPNAIKSFTYLS